MYSRHSPGAANQKDLDQVEEQTLRGPALRSYLSGFTSLIKQLESAMTSLPHVDSSGYSACPLDLANELYAKKEKLEAQVSARMPSLYRVHAALQKEVDRCKKNLDKIQGDAGRLNLQKTRDKYSQAEQAQELELRQATDDRDAIFLAIKKAEAILKISKGRHLPKTKDKIGDKAGDKGKDGKASSDAGSRSSGGEKLGSSLKGLLSTGQRQQSKSSPTMRS